MTKRLANAFKNCQTGPVDTFVLSSVIGDLHLSCCQKAIHTLNRTDIQTFSPDTSVDVTFKHESKLQTDSSYEVAMQCANWLQMYFKQPSKVDTLALPPICPLMNSQQFCDTFTKRVWKTLAENVRFGHTVSYGQLSSLSGSSSKASRAVGQAMRNNPVMILVPCHRVIPSDGSVGNYNGGSTVKVWLLEHEKCLKKE